MNNEVNTPLAESSGQATGLAPSTCWAPSSDRPIFRPKNYRPAQDEQWEMKQAVIARDGLTTCFWCREPFKSADDATLEHIKPLFDGGVHDLRNCTLACMDCNLQNEPKKLVCQREEAQKIRELRAELNRAKNGGDAEKCDDHVQARFEAVRRSMAGKPLTFATATFMLRGIHRQLGRLPPTKHERHVFKGHFNRWLSALPNTEASNTGLSKPTE